jgi:hypothetical protein
MADIEMLSVVALLEDLPEEALVRGQVGTVVENRAPGVHEVEARDENGRAYAIVRRVGASGSAASADRPLPSSGGCCPSRTDEAGAASEVKA